MGMEQESEYELADGRWISQYYSYSRQQLFAKSLGLLVGSDVYSVVVEWNCSGPLWGPKGAVDCRQDI